MGTFTVGSFSNGQRPWNNRITACFPFSHDSANSLNTNNGIKIVETIEASQELSTCKDRKCNGREKIDFELKIP